MNLAENVLQHKVLHLSPKNVCRSLLTFCTKEQQALLLNVLKNDKHLLGLEYLKEMPDQHLPCRVIPQHKQVK
jgi:hypothetical protein